MTAFVALLSRELKLAARQKSDWVMPPLFFLIVVTIFALGGRPNDPALVGFAPAIVWVGALLAALLSLERLFRGDHEDGTLEQILVCGASPVLLVGAKLLGHWVISGLPLVLLSAPLALQLGMSGNEVLALVVGLLLGTPLLSLIGGFAAALTVGLARSGALLPILVLPLLAPVVIFGAGAVRNAAAGLDVSGPLYFLGALLVLGITLMPWVITAALRNTFD